MTEKEFSGIINSTKGVVLTAIRKNIEERFYNYIDDIVQDTYIRAYKSLVKNKFKGDSSLETWLYAIARNETLRINKKLSREEEKLRKVIDSMDDNNIRGSRKNFVNYDIIDLHDSIAKLPDIYGEVMKLQLNGFSEKQIARQLDIKTGTVKSRASRAREMLHKMLKEVEYGN
ncbi:MAG: sigma-70 family RNA polymerase sigma factor [Spirochaetes bacterium]|nr:sigma-70 family RNA polymerase sigma factor [Spirochaetota bacterium]